MTTRPNILTEMPNLPTLFTAIIAALRVAIGTHVGRHPAQAPLLNHACDYLSRAMTRFQRLLARWQAGALPAPRPARPGQPAAPRTTLPRRVRRRRGHAGAGGRDCCEGVWQRARRRRASPWHHTRPIAALSPDRSAALIADDAYPDTAADAALDAFV